MEEIKVEVLETEEQKTEEKYVDKIKDGLKKGVKTIKDEVLNVVHWARENKEDAAILTGALLGGFKLVRTMRGTKTAKERDFEDRQRRYYDYKHGVWYDLKREMSTREKIELERRIDSGESAGQILREFRILKY